MLVGKIDSSGELYQYFHDGLGSITMICDTTGSYENLYVYDDFGNFRMMEESGPVQNHYYYTGQERDAAPSGLYNLRARYYAAGIGRFTQEDPVLSMGEVVIGNSNCSKCEFDLLTNSSSRIKVLGRYRREPQNLNAYLYVGNNPIINSDEYGLMIRPRKFRSIECVKWSYLCFIRGRKCRQELAKKHPCKTDKDLEEWLEWNEKPDRDIHRLANM